MHQICKQCDSSFDITQDDLAFYDKVSPVFSGKKESIPPPTLCPECRLQHRLSFRNEWNFYRRTCDATKKEIISMYPPKSPYTVYDQEAWWSDEYDPCAYGKEYDFSKRFFDQFHALNLTVPKAAIQNAKSENCAFTNYSAQNRNCYLLVGGLGAEDCFYSYRVFYSRDCSDCYDLIQCELCYECSECSGLHTCVHCRQCHDSRNLHFCEDCSGCQDCFGCVNLRNKRFHILNKPHSEAEYHRIIEDGAKRRSVFAQEFERLRSRMPHRYASIIQCEDVRGDQLLNCQHCRDCFTLKNSRDCAFMMVGNHDQDSMDANFCDDCELQYQSSNLQENYHVLFGILLWYCKECMYTMNSFNSHHLFGCTGMKKHAYCILNKQYTQEEYEALVPKIIEHMRATGEYGTFFPVTISPFAYNETTAAEYVPLSRAEVEQRGWKWLERGNEMPKADRIIPASQLPDTIDEIPDDILNWAVECETTKRPFKIIKQELEFYRKMHLPIPHFHPDERHRRRMALRNPRKLWDRTCAKCQKPIATSYAPERPEIVFCEECYLQSVY